MLVKEIKDLGYEVRRNFKQETVEILKEGNIVYTLSCLDLDVRTDEALQRMKDTLGIK